MCPMSGLIWPSDGPGDQPVLVELADRDGDVVLAHGVVVERLAIHVYDEGVTDGARRIAIGVLQHAGGVDCDVALRVA